MTEFENLQIIEGDITEAKEKYIVHQCNCITKLSKGLAKTLYDKFPWANIYMTPTKRSDTPGTIKVTGNGANHRFIINLFGQYKGGKPKPGTQDSAEKRLEYFRSGLRKISEIPNLESVALPFNIGCGLAGGDWPSYLHEIEEFSRQTNARVTIYKFVE